MADTSKKKQGEKKPAAEQQPAADTAPERPSDVKLLMRQMERLVYKDDPVPYSEKEAAQFIIDLNTKHGEKAVSSFIDRALNGEKLKGYERKFIKRNSQQFRNSIEPMERRRFFGLTAMAGGGVVMGNYLVSPFIPSMSGGKPVEQMKQGEEIKEMKEGGEKSRFEKLHERRDELVKKIRETPHDPKTTTLEQQEAFNSELDTQILAMIREFEPGKRTSIENIATFFGGSVGFWFGVNSADKGNGEIKSAYRETARFIARRASEVIAEEKRQYERGASL